MKILIVSDTHGRDWGLEEAIEKEAPFDMLVHCGDVEGREFYVEAMAGCPCCIVAGNNDFFSDLPREDEFKIAGSFCTRDGRAEAERGFVQYFCASLWF